MDHTCSETNSVSANHCSDLQPCNQFTFVSWSANFNKLLDLNFNFCWGWLSRSFFGLLGCSASSEINKKKNKCSPHWGVFWTRLCNYKTVDHSMGLTRHADLHVNLVHSMRTFITKDKKQTNSQVGLMFLSLCVCQVAALEMEDNLLKGLCYIQDEQMSNKWNTRFPYLVVMKR